MTAHRSQEMKQEGIKLSWFIYKGFKVTWLIWLMFFYFSIFLVFFDFLVINISGDDCVMSRGEFIDVQSHPSLYKHRCLLSSPL